MTAPDEQSSPPPRRGTVGRATATRDGLHRCLLELCPICRTAELLRDAGAPELRGQLDDVGREALLTLRSLVDHYLERLDQHAGAERPGRAHPDRLEPSERPLSLAAERQLGDQLDDRARSRACSIALRRRQPAQLVDLVVRLELARRGRLIRQ